MKSVGKTIAGGLVAVALVTGAGSAKAVTWEILGKLSVEYTLQTPQELLSLEGTPFSAYLTYDENALPTSTLSPEFTNYANQGSFVVNTVLGSATGALDNLQTFISTGTPGQGSNFNGGATHVGLTGAISTLGLIPRGFGFQFQEVPWHLNVGLTSFALPSELNLQDFGGFNILGLVFSSPAGNPLDTRLLGVMDSVSAIPEPQTYMMMLAGVALLGWRARNLAG
ncbi:putative secreted protein with PEP-CTERM sorting signal [Nitrosospira sp. Nsp2]|uniref:PEP-CTERM sorting domain-containing protein n=1 Tax=Nitrosospira sp. Nsp2 TaxID=136548 RepID=UPI000D2F5E94|nr:PEP-CTERM sorting domain-containing protein [Nitrosospira sp. Nsp2]PTR17476.1 putative secreted protein with PEP-CTERM sorting signal [Nitrosospira sp. Nsp2]